MMLNFSGAEGIIILLQEPKHLLAKHRPTVVGWNLGVVGYFYKGN